MHLCHPAIHQVIQQLGLPKAVNHPCMWAQSGAGSTGRIQGQAAPRASRHTAACHVAHRCYAAVLQSSNTMRQIKRFSPCLPAWRAIFMIAGTLRLRRLMRPSIPSAAGTCRAQAQAGRCGRAVVQTGTFSAAAVHAHCPLLQETGYARDPPSACSAACRCCSCPWEDEGDA